MTKEELISFLVSLGTERELSLLIAKRLDGEIYTLEEQIRERYYLYEAPLFNLEEIKEDQRKVVDKYRKLLSEDTKEGIRNIFIDQLENKVFFNAGMHEENTKMIDNLTKGNYKPTKEIEGAVDEMVKRIDKEIYEELSIEIDGKSYELKEQLKARGCGNKLLLSKSGYIKAIENEDYPCFLTVGDIQDKVTLLYFISGLEKSFLKKDNLKLIEQKKSLAKFLLIFIPGITILFFICIY